MVLPFFVTAWWSSEWRFKNMCRRMAVKVPRLPLSSGEKSG